MGYPCAPEDGVLQGGPRPWCRPRFRVLPPSPHQGPHPLPERLAVPRVRKGGARSSRAVPPNVGRPCVRARHPSSGLAVPGPGSAIGPSRSVRDPLPRPLPDPRSTGDPDHHPRKVGHAGTEPPAPTDALRPSRIRWPRDSIEDGFPLCSPTRLHPADCGTPHRRSRSGGPERRFLKGPGYARCGLFRCGLVSTMGSPEAPGRWASAPDRCGSDPPARRAQGLGTEVAGNALPQRVCSWRCRVSVAALRPFPGRRLGFPYVGIPPCSASIRAMCIQVPGHEGGGALVKVLSVPPDPSFQVGGDRGPASPIPTVSACGGNVYPVLQGKQDLGGAVLDGRSSFSGDDTTPPPGRSRCTGPVIGAGELAYSPLPSRVRHTDEALPQPEWCSTTRMSAANTFSWRRGMGSAPSHAPFIVRLDPGRQRMVHHPGGIFPSPPPAH